MSSVEVTAMQRALAAEHAIIWGYGLAGAHLAGAQQELATTIWDAHRERRDQLIALLRAAGATPVPPKPAYDVPVHVTDAGAATRLAARLEAGGAGAAWDLVTASPPNSSSRRLAVAWLTSAAVDEVRLAQAVPSALPGAPPA